MTDTTPTPTTAAAPQSVPAAGQADEIRTPDQSDSTVQMDVSEQAPAAEPPAPKGLRVGDADREAVAHALREAALEGRLTPDELATREAAAYAAVTAPDLFALVTDLPVARELAASQLAPYGLRPEPVAAGSPQPVAPATSSTPTTLWSVLSEVKRTGKWDVPERLSVHVALGETRLDLRDAVLTAPVTTIDIMGTLGEVKVIVPDSWRIECTGSGVAGSYEVKDVDAAVPPAPDAPLAAVLRRHAAR